MYRVLASAIFVLLVSAASGAAQTGSARPRVLPASGQTLGVFREAVDAPGEVLRAFQVRAGSVQELVLPPNSRRPFQLRVMLGGQVRTLALHPHSLLAPDFQAIASDGVTDVVVPTPIEVTYQGTVHGDPHSLVAADLRAGELSALIEVDGQTWSIQPVTDALAHSPRGYHVSYNALDVRNPDFPCADGIGGFENGPGLGSEDGTQGPQCGGHQTAEIALDLNNGYFLNKGGGTVAGSVSAALSRINKVDALYKRSIGDGGIEVCYEVTAIIVRTVQVYPAPNVCLPGGAAEHFVYRWWALHSGVHRDVAHLLVGDGQFQGVVGCAILDSICVEDNPFTAGAYGASRVTNSNDFINTSLVAHELGHNWGARHCNFAGANCFIMWGGGNPCCGRTKFGPVSQTAMLAFKGTRTCLTDGCPNCPPDCSQAVASPGDLWPPNHKYVPIEITGVTDPDGDPVTITIDSIYQDEPMTGPGGGSGNTSPDGMGVGTAAALVRAEREGGGNGRVYRITFTADDGHGNTCQSTVTVCVPHNNGGECVDDNDAATYDSTQG